MKTYFLHFLLVVLLLASETSSRTTTKEHATLLAIKKEWGDPPQFASWDTTDHCSWPGVSCMARGGGLVTGLSFKFLSLTGNIPLSVCKLKYLIHLDFSYNNLTGRFPGTTLYTCSWLRYLDISNNHFHGVLPEDINQLSPYMKHLNLCNNNFSGVLPMAMAELSALQNLLLDTNSFAGKIPEAFSSLKELTMLDMWGNKLSGSIPLWIWQHKKLEILYLYDNRLTGELPYNITAVNLIELDLSGNKLTGWIPNDFGILKKLTILILANNEFTGSIPKSIGLLPNLQSIQLSYNMLSDELPPDLGKHSPLGSVEVYDNNLSGSLPEHLCANGKLFDLAVSNNSFSGELPASIGSCLSLDNIMLDSNNFSGEFPENIWSFPLLYTLLISDNNFTGIMPTKISSNISRIEMENNHFSGSIPTVATGLSVLIVKNNQLSGELPTSIKLLQNLKTLDLSNNQISGAIPPWSLGMISSLDVLDLSNNELTGKIPPDLGSHLIATLNFSFNQLDGEVPLPLQTAGYNRSFLGNRRLCARWGWRINLPKCQGGPHLLKHIRILPVLGVILLIASLSIIIWLFFPCWKNTQVVIEDVADWKMTPLITPLGFTQSDVLNNISEENKIGSGGSGNVYRVHLPSLDGATENHSSRIVAVKKICNRGNLDEKQFDSEVETLGSIKHNNIIKLLCSISSQDSKLLVYEYMENGSLNHWLHRRDRMDAPAPLDWPTRLGIAIGAAKGLNYLHQEYVHAIIHRDIKSSNILLDSEFNAKIADFGFARLLVNPDEPSLTSRICGTRGYMAPEYCMHEAKASEKTDVYSFGVVLLELTTGKVANSGEGLDILADRVWKEFKGNCLSKDEIDEHIRDSAHLDDILEVLNLGLTCTGRKPDDRPSMNEVLNWLKQFDRRHNSPEAEAEPHRSRYDGSSMLLMSDKGKEICSGEGSTEYQINPRFEAVGSIEYQHNPRFEAGCSEAGPSGPRFDASMS